ADMGEMQMELPANTFPMMTGTGPYGPIEMGGMFSTLKVRKDLAPGDYRDPGWYEPPAGTQAQEVSVPNDAPRAPDARPDPPAAGTPSARKPMGHSHEGH
ncbi:MAG: hypothetical protein KDA53_18105, partial [Hyphomonas sp.]|nr:hypothetical protein [Hyphomonas sp.]